MTQGTLRPGESRVIRETPCPPEWMVHTNQFWKLRRAARYLLRSRVDRFEFIKDDWHVGWDEALEAVRLLREVATLLPTHPSEAWCSGKLGTVYEICCPNCKTVFEWQGKFYAPRCPECQRWLNERTPKERR